MRIVEQGQIVESHGDFWVVRAKRLLHDRDPALVGSFGLRILALVRVNGAEIVQGESQFGLDFASSFV